MCGDVAATHGFGYSPDLDPVEGSTHFGTEGDDVIIVTNGPVTVHALGGDDLICVNDVLPTAEGAVVVIEGGNGVDTVIASAATSELCTAENTTNCDNPPLDPCDPFCGLALGSTDRRTDGLDLYLQEAAIGRQLDFVRLYERDPDANFFTSNDQALADEGRTLVYSWKVSRDTANGDTWAKVASGEYDADLMRVAQQIVDSGHTIFFALHHEPEDNVGTVPGKYGTEADYVAMYQHVHSVMDPIAGDQMIWFINYMGHSFGPFDQVEAMYPGDEIIDWLSWNPYNWYGCHVNGPWKSFAPQAAPFYDWATANHPDKPLMIGETASNELEGDPDAKANWIADMGAALQNDFPRIRALMWFNQSTNTGFCERRIDSSQESIDSLTAVGADPYFNPDIVVG